MTTLELTLSTDYVREWTTTFAIREFLQNLVDVGGDYTTHCANGVATFMNAVAPPLTRNYLVLGQTSKRDSATAIGHFGEGFKLATLVLVRQKYAVTIMTQTEIWEAFIAMSEGFGVEVLQFRCTPRTEAWTGVQVTVTAPEGAAATLDEAYAEAAQLFISLTANTPIHPDVPEIMTSPVGKVYLRGALVAENTGSPFSYNFSEGITNRDRSSTRLRLFKEQLLALWEKVRLVDSALYRELSLIPSGAWEVDALCYGHVTSLLPLFEAWLDDKPLAAGYRQTFVDATAMCEELLAEAKLKRVVLHIAPPVLQEAARVLMASDEYEYVPTAYSAILKKYNLVTRRELAMILGTRKGYTPRADKDLPTQSLRHLLYARAFVAKQSTQYVELRHYRIIAGKIDDACVAGLHVGVNKTIVICEQTLTDLPATLVTLCHEMAHYYYSSHGAEHGRSTEDFFTLLLRHLNVRVV